MFRQLPHWINTPPVFLPLALCAAVARHGTGQGFLPCAPLPCVPPPRPRPGEGQALRSARPAQRTMSRPLWSRYHYGHPDLLDKSQMISQGGISKATRGLNLSEDVFAGMDATLRGSTIVHREYYQAEVAVVLLQ